MSWYEAFNRTALSKFLNSPAGRVFRLAAGIGFLVAGFAWRAHALGVVAMAWGVLPLSAGAFDICWISAMLSGPLHGSQIRSRFQAGQQA